MRKAKPTAADRLSRTWDEVVAGRKTIQQYDKIRKEIQNENSRGH